VIVALDDGDGLQSIEDVAGAALLSDERPWIRNKAGLNSYLNSNGTRAFDGPPALRSPSATSPADLISSSIGARHTL
jgi:hypothetical protein